MKLCLLVLTVVVAVVLVPDLSEGRTVSRCELKKKLWDRIDVDKSKEQVLAVLICELERMSSLNTSAVVHMGQEDATAEEGDQAEGGVQAEEEPAEGGVQAEEEPAEGGVQAEEEPAEGGVQAEEEPAEGGVQAEEEPAEGGVQAEEEPADEEGQAEEPSRKKRAAGKIRQRREAEPSEEEVVNCESLLNSLMSTCDQSQMIEAESNVGDDATVPWSLRRYGVFQLSDGYFCDSGKRTSLNVCGKQCSDFTDDNIADDLDCFVEYGCWDQIIQERENECTCDPNFFSACN